MKKKNKLVYGVSVNDYDGRVKINGKMIKSYNTWKNMLERCYDDKLLKKYPTYTGCTVCEEWLYFSNFKKWFDEHYRWDLDEKGLRPCLDKDLLVKGNKIYSHDTCIFLPNSVNSFLANKQSRNTSGYIGVTWCKKHSKWEAQITDFNNGKNKFLGYFIDILDAHFSYVKARKIQCEKVKEYLRSLGYKEDVVSKIR